MKLHLSRIKINHLSLFSPILVVGYVHELEELWDKWTKFHPWMEQNICKSCKLVLTIC
jgi:hypothetical protein